MMCYFAVQFILGEDGGFGSDVLIALAVPPGYIPSGVAAASQYLALVLQFDYSHRWLLIFLFHCYVLLT